MLLDLRQYENIEFVFDSDWGLDVASGTQVSALNPIYTVLPPTHESPESNDSNRTERSWEVVNGENAFERVHSGTISGQMTQALFE